MKYNTLIFDIYNLYYKFVYVNKDKVINYKGKKIHVEGIEGTLKGIQHYINKYAKTPDKVKLFFLYDNAKTSLLRMRDEVSKGQYKEGREAMPNWFYSGLNYLELILANCYNNAFAFRVKGLEADDYVESIISSYCSPTDNILMFSEDMDWCRYLNQESPTVNQYMKKAVYSTIAFEEEYKFYPTTSSICFYKTFYGDDSDKIKGVFKKHLPFTLFLKIIKDCNNIYDFISKSINKKLAYLDAGWIERVRRDEQWLIDNWTLVEGIRLDNADLENFKTVCKFKKEKLKLLYTSLNFAKDFDSRLDLNYNLEDNFFDEFLLSAKTERA